ncbi:MAG: hypothetical protein JXR12_11085 [Neptunomonas phycophila]|uniref:hypothetical protein n=1 Tax=Neptunomonas phycophila TaxID=1572645 RepID=UPI003B8ABA3C
MTSRSELEIIFHEAAKELEKPTPIKELTSSIISIEKRYVYGEASLNNRLRLIRELIEDARKKGDIC